MASCGRDDRQETPGASTAADTLAWLNHADSARYVGMTVCRSCHPGIYDTYIRTGMGRSIGIASRSKSAADFIKAEVHDPFTGFHYRAFWQKDSLFIKEFRPGKAKGDTAYSRVEQVSFIIGSGQHTNSHLQNQNGYIHQMPMTYYTQKKRWDLPPGFENGVNTRFSRKIGLECMSCHNAYPDMVKGSENKFRAVPGGIDCERCHGPGSIHVNARRTGSRIDTSKYTDRTIVNPAKLPLERQFDVCQRCHLQGNAVLREGRSFYDFRPGMKLSDHLAVFLPKYTGAEDEFIMASHAERLKMSPCFIRSAERAGTQNALRPYKGAMTCVTCHNPHVSVLETGKQLFNKACSGCHGAPGTATLTAAHARVKKWSDCVSCHMPVSGSTDIPHVTVHDHYIRRPVSKAEKAKIRRFAGLYAVNESNPSALVKARAYLNQYEKFSQEPVYLDSAEKLLAGVPPRDALHALVQLHFTRGRYGEVTGLVSESGSADLLNHVLVNSSYDNADAWACYRIGESFSHEKNHGEAVKWLRKAVELAPYNLDFRNKLATALSGVNETEAAVREFEFILRENPRFVAAYSNLGYLKLVQGFPAEAIRLYKAALALDPDYLPLLLNLAGYYLYTGDSGMAKQYLEQVMTKDPNNPQAAEALRQLKRK